MPNLSVYQVKQNCSRTIEFLRRNPSASPTPKMANRRPPAPLFSATLTSLELEGLDTGSTNQALHMLVAPCQKEAPLALTGCTPLAFAQQFALDAGDPAIDQPKRLPVPYLPPPFNHPQVKGLHCRPTCQINVSPLSPANGSPIPLTFRRA